jgi:hypothetical protein
MQTYQIKVSQDLPIEVIKAALHSLGEVTIRRVIAKAPKQERIYQDPVIVYKNGVPVDEIDPITVEKRIAKFMSMVNRGKDSDGRSKANFERLHFASDDENAVTEEYVRRFCSQFHHVKTNYELNGELISA